MNLLNRGVFPALLLLCLFIWGPTAFGQIVNFKPLERGEYTEEEEKLTILRGLEVSFQYAVQMLREKHDDLSNAAENTQFKQDFRLALRTVFHRDVEFHLVLDPSIRAFDGGESRERRQEDDRIAETQPTTLNAREAFLLYKFNPGSGLILGKQEVSIGDRRGKVFNGIAPAITYDCKVGTWCMPFGAIRVGPMSTDWIYHWALEYTAWEDKKKGYDNDTFKFELFRIIYTENNVPLGKNRGPGLFNGDDPDNLAAVDPSQETDAVGNPIYYDAKGVDYFGFRLTWESGSFFWNFDFTSAQGNRELHRFRPLGTSQSVNTLDFGGVPQTVFRQSVSGAVWESEIGFRGPDWKFGVRLLQADGDLGLDPADKAGLSTDLGGFYEITPGSYRGSRLYFNGSDNDVESGSGLGHSVNNIQMIGFFYDFTDPQDKEMDYSLGIYKLDLVEPVLDALGARQSSVGLEIDNLLSFYIHKAIKLQIEINIINTGGAFTIADHVRPSGVSTDLFTQGILRFVYSF